MADPIKAAIRAAKKRLPLEPDKVIRERLSWITDDPAEAYRIGAEEAQREILGRLETMRAPEGGEDGV